MSFFGHRYAAANNKYITNFDATKESCWCILMQIIYLVGLCVIDHLLVDWNELYKNIMNKMLCTKLFLYKMLYRKFLSELYDLHNDYPFAPEKE